MIRVLWCVTYETSLWISLHFFDSNRSRSLFCNNNMLSQYKSRFKIRTNTFSHSLSWSAHHWLQSFPWFLEYETPLFHLVHGIPILVFLDGLHLFFGFFGRPLENNRFVEGHVNWSIDVIMKIILIVDFTFHIENPIARGSQKFHDAFTDEKRKIESELIC